MLLPLFAVASEQTNFHFCITPLSDFLLQLVSDSVVQ